MSRKTTLALLALPGGLVPAQWPEMARPELKNHADGCRFLHIAAPGA